MTYSPQVCALIPAHFKSNSPLLLKTPTTPAQVWHSRAGGSARASETPPLPQPFSKRFNLHNHCVFVTISQGMHRGSVTSAGGKGSTPCLVVTDADGTALTKMCYAFSLVKLVFVSPGVVSAIDDSALILQVSASAPHSFLSLGVPAPSNTNAQSLN